MKLILIKHGETKEGKKGMILGSLPGTLTEKGKKDAIQKKQVLPLII